MKSLYFVRHGLSVTNTQGIISGAGTDTPLTVEGVLQAIEAGKWAKNQGLQFDIIISSPQKRAHETAKKIAEQIDYDMDGIIIEDKLKERHFGEAEGVFFDDLFPSREEFLKDPFAMDTIKGVETITDLHYRAKNVFKELKSLPHENVLIVSHGAFGRAFERAIKNMHLTEIGIQFQNAQIVKLI